MKNRFILALIVLLGGHTVHASSPVTDGFLIPGVDFSKLILEEGAWCRYRIADEALGTVDSSEVYIGVPSREMTPQGQAYWVEIETRPVGASSDEAQVLKLQIGRAHV